MSEHVPCDGELRVVVDGSGDRTLLAIKDGTMLRFWTETSQVEAVANGQTVRLSTLGGKCELRGEGEKARIIVDTEGERLECEFPTKDLAEALAEVRERGNQEDW